MPVPACHYLTMGPACQCQYLIVPVPACHHLTLVPACKSVTSWFPYQVSYSASASMPVSYRASASLPLSYRASASLLVSYSRASILPVLSIEQSMVGCSITSLHLSRLSKKTPQQPLSPGKEVCSSRKTSRASSNWGLHCVPVSRATWTFGIWNLMGPQLPIPIIMQL